MQKIRDRRHKVSIGKRLKELRKSRRLRIEDVCRDLNISTATLSRYETDKRQPAADMMQKLADYYNVSMDYLYGRAPVSEDSLSDYEREMLSAFRRVPNDVKDDIVDFLNHKLSKKEALRK